MPDRRAETIASKFHAEYEAMASFFGYKTRPETAVPWSLVPAENKRLMTAVVQVLLDADVIRAGGGVAE